MKHISLHISYLEVVKSITAIRRGIDNAPDEHQLMFIRFLAEIVLEPLRAGLGGKPIYYASFFRCGKLNKLIGGASGSQHMAKRGAAADIDQDGHTNCPTNREVFDYIKDNCIFDQLIYEFGDDENPGWVHVSYNPDKNRKQVLRAIKVEGKTKYINYDSTTKSSE